MPYLNINTNAKDGFPATGFSTDVTIGGLKVEGVHSIQILNIEPDDIVKATIEVSVTLGQEGHLIDTLQKELHRLKR